MRPDAVAGITGPEDQGSSDDIATVQDAIFNRANFSSIATDEKGVIQIYPRGTPCTEAMACVAISRTSGGAWVGGCWRPDRSHAAARQRMDGTGDAQH